MLKNIKKSSSDRFISVIIPIFNEEESISRLLEKLEKVFYRLTVQHEFIAVNDGSEDRSFDKLIELSYRIPALKIINFRRNYGQTAAIMAGVDYASGDISILIDADLQNDPDDIPRLLEKLDEGYDVVSGWRKDRKDDAVKRNFVSRVANSIISRISGVHIHDYGCTLKVYRSEVLQGMRLYGEMHRFIPIYASWMGAKVTELAVQHHPRQFGSSSYGLERVFKVILDLVVVKFLDRYLVKPIYLFGGFGIISLIVSFILFSYMIYLKLWVGISMIKTPLPVLSSFSFMIGIMSILMGLLAEIMVRTYFESQKRTAYAVSDLVNFDDKA